MGHEGKRKCLLVTCSNTFAQFKDVFRVFVFGGGCLLNCGHDVRNITDSANYAFGK